MTKVKKEQSRASWRQRVAGFGVYVDEYCRNCTLVGFAYIANGHLHPSERIFWLISVVVSALGVFYLINEYQTDFESRAVSIVYESVPVLAPVKFPSLCVCQTDPGSDYGGGLEDYVQSLGVGRGETYNYDVHQHVVLILFPERYSYDTIAKHCNPYQDCEECAKCPLDGYRHIATQFGLNCTDIFNECSLSDKPYDCCKYFLPMMTPYGRCFFLNSLQNNRPDSGHWLPTMLDRNSKPEMRFSFKKDVRVAAFNEEDLPTLTIPFPEITTVMGRTTIFKFYSEAMINDPEIRDIAPAARDCYFSDEVPDWSIFHAYSFGTCLSDCTRIYHMELCNCTLYNFNPFEDKRFPDCDFKGYLCLEKHRMIKANLRSMLYYQSKNPEVNCRCIPSCTEFEINSIFTMNQRTGPNANDSRLIISMSMWPTNQYRRQALRTNLDVVVSIGGILGLFLGASILSAIEFIYYFTVRAGNTRMMRKKLEKVKK